MEYRYLLSLPGLIGRLPIEDWWCRWRSVEFDGLKVMVLDPADAIFHICVHQWLEHRSNLRLRWLLDVDKMPKYMMQRYHISSRMLLPLYYGK